MRKLCALLTSVTLILGLALMPVAAAPPKVILPPGQPSQVVIELFLGQKVGNSDGAKFDLPEAPMIEGKHALAPVRSVVNKLGGKVDFDKKNKQVTLTFGETEIIMQAGKTVCYVNGQRRLLPIAPQQKGNNGTMFVPVRFLCEILGARVDFLPNGKIKICWQRQPERPERPRPTPEPVIIKHRVLPDAVLQADLLQIDPAKPLLWYGPAANLLESPGRNLHHQNVLVVVRGWQGSTGYGIAVESLHVNDGELVVRVKLINPDPDSSQATVMQYVYQALLLPEELPEIHGWRIESSEGRLLNSQRLLTSIPYREATRVNVNWADLESAGIAVKPVQLAGEDKLLLVVKRGPVPSTGYGVKLQSLELNAWGSITARVQYSDPAPDSMQADVICYPYTAVYIDPIYLGHDVQVAIEKETWSRLVPVRAILKPNIDRSWRGVLTGYGRELLQNPGEWADKALLVAFRGYCSTGGYGISIDALVRDGERVLVRVSEQDPPPGAIVTQAITYPYHIVQIPDELVGCEFVLEK